MAIHQMTMNSIPPVISTNRSEKTRGTCTYCGDPLGQEKTMDHIPPKSLFEKRFRHLLPTVPSCKACNNGASKDDEYFIRIALSKECSNSPSVNEVIASFKRNLDREESKGYRNEFFDSITPTQFPAENGKEEPAMGFQIDLQRICKVVFRTVKGLLWGESCIRLPDDFGIVMAPYINLKFLEQDLLNIFLHILLAEQTSKKEKKVVIPDIIEYWWNQLFPTNLLHSAWVLRFYKDAYFICILTPREEDLLKIFKPAIDSNLIVVSN